MNTKHLMTGVAIATSLVAAADCRTNTLKSTATDWTLASSYTDTTFVPGEGDVVKLEYEKAYAVTSGSANWEKMNTWKRIIPDGKTASTFTVTVASGEAVFHPAFTAYAVNSAANGKFVKEGAGTLRFDGADVTFTNSGGIGVCAYNVPAVVKEGTLVYNNGLPTATLSYTYYVNSIDVKSGATVVLANPGTSSGMYFQIQGGLTGETGAVVTNQVSATIGLYLFNGTAAEPKVYAGKLGGNITIHVADDSYARLTGTESTMAGYIYPHTGVLEVSKLGAKASGTGSIGQGTYVWFNSAGIFRYIGTEDTTFDRELVVDTSNGGTPSTFDCGSYGGVTLNGKFLPAGSNKKTHEVLVLAGENTEHESVVAKECVMQSTWKNEAGKALGLSFIKRGNGIWRFADRSDVSSGSWQLAGAWKVEEGTLRYDTIAELGRTSSLGCGTNMFTHEVCQYDESKRVTDFLFLGGTNTVPGTFEYVGTNAVTCSSRPIKVSDTGVFKNGSAKDYASIRWRGVSSGKDGSTFVLDGGSTVATNEVADITGNMNVTKKGTGTWRISGDLTFNGKLSVEAGKLFVKKTLPGAYKWFRWTWKQLGNGNGASKCQVEAFSLFDNNGFSQANDTITAPNGSQDPAPHQVAFVSNLRHICYSSGDGATNDLDRMFTTPNGSYGFSAQFRYPAGYGTEAIIGKANPTLWPSIVVHLKDTANEIKYWDFCNVWCNNNGSGVTESLLEGSVDGLHWETAFEQDATQFHEDCTNGTWRWAFCGKPLSGTYSKTARHYDESTKTMLGRALTSSASTRTYSVLTGCTGVSVAAGAELIADGEDITIGGITVKSAGNGTINGFALASTGSVSLESDFASGVTELDGPTLTDVTGGISGWNVKIDGVVAGRYTARIADGKIKVSRPGMRVIIR